jgi:8-oxo-dGTP diphosphatase
VTDAPTPTSFARPRVAAGALFFDELGRVLLVRPTYKDHWDIPGGYVEPGESPRDACLREVREELGLVIATVALLAVDWAPNGGEGDKLLFVFDGGTPTSDQLAEIKLATAEIAEWRFVAPEDFEVYVTDRLTRRIRTAISARAGARAVYAEHGTGT